MPTEDDFEEDVVEHLSENGWSSPGENGKAQVLDEKFGRSLSEPIYAELLERNVKRINPKIPESNLDTVINEFLSRISRRGDLMEVSLEIQRILKSDISDERFRTRDKDNEKAYVDFIDFEDLDQNDFHVVRQFGVQDNRTSWFDVALLVNGIPIAIGELKELSSGNTVDEAVEDLVDYQKSTSSAFYTPTVLFGATRDPIQDDEVGFLYGATGANKEHFVPWADEDGNRFGTFESIETLLTPSMILEILEDFSVFRKEDGSLVNYIPRHQQYHTAKRMYSEAMKSKSSKKGDRRLVWHTQGSGKSLSMVFATNYIRRRHGDARVLILVDSTALEDEMVDRFRDQVSPSVSYNHIKSGSELEDMLEDPSSGGVHICTVQKFENVDVKCDHDFLITFEDEIHRNMEDLWGNRMDKALDRSLRIGFTGTPTSSSLEIYATEDGNYLHTYLMEQAVKEGVVTEISLTTKHEDVEYSPAKLDEKFKEEIEKAKEKINEDNPKPEDILDTMNQTVKSEWEEHAKKVSEDICTHFSRKVDPLDLKGMVVTPSRYSAALVSDKLGDIMGEERVATVYSDQNLKAGDDNIAHEKLNLIEEQRSDDDIIGEFKNEDEPSIVVVCDKLLTGFDAPVLKTLYLDRQFSGKHTFMQAASRVVRPHENKRIGEIVDYHGGVEKEDIGYGSDDLSYIVTDKDELEEEMQSKFKNIEDILEINLSEATHSQISSRLSRSEADMKKFVDLTEEINEIWNELTPDHERTEPYREERDKIRQVYRQIKVFEDKKEKQIKDLVNEATKNALNEASIHKGFEKDETEKVGTDDLSSDTQVSIEAKKLKDMFDERKKFHPQYEELSEMVESLFDDWEKSELSEEEFEKRVEEMKEDIKGLELDDREQMCIESITVLFEQHKVPNPEDVAQKFVNMVDSEFGDDYNRILKYGHDQVLYPDLMAMFGRNGVTDAKKIEHLIQEGVRYMKRIKSTK